jgi:hypothetical protein
MIRLVKLLALAGITLGGAFLTTAAQASAANFNVSFAIHNADTSISMIRNTTPLPTGVTGLINPPAAISPGNNDPASGFATYSLTLPTAGHPQSTSLQYVNVNNSLDECTFAIKVSFVTGPMYLLHFSSDQSRCTVPADQQNSNGIFTGTTSIVNWAA